MADPRRVRKVVTKLRRTFSRDPLLRPLGRTPDSIINRFLARRRMGRADLFRGGTTLAPHRHRIAAMLAAHKLPLNHVVARHWPALKRADHLCAHCADTRRCERWLRQPAPEAAPRTFCPNAATFAQWQRNSGAGTSDRAIADGETILDAGVTQTRELLQQQSGPASDAGPGWRRYP